MTAGIFPAVIFYPQADVKIQGKAKRNALRLKIKSLEPDRNALKWKTKSLNSEISVVKMKRNTRKSIKPFKIHAPKTRINTKFAAFD